MTTEVDNREARVLVNRALVDIYTIRAAVSLLGLLPGDAAWRSTVADLRVSSAAVRDQLRAVDCHLAGVGA